MSTNRSSVVLWRGPSQLDGSPIRLVLVRDSTNRKTGAMMQAYILPDPVSPAESMRTGQDAAVCGDCLFRGTPGPDGKREDRGCYVVYAQGPQSTWRATTPRATLSLEDAAALLLGAKIRLGAWGDPAAVPLAVWEVLLQGVSMWTAYTHQWRTLPAAWQRFCMASVDNAWDAAEARAAGWRTYRAGAAPMTGEVVCPSVRGRHCIDCGACDGTRNGTKDGRVSIFIEAHGAGAKHARRVAAEALARRLEAAR